MTLRGELPDADWAIGPDPVNDGWTVADLLTRQAARTPTEVAMTFEREHLTYAELMTRAKLAAAVLIESGAGPTSPVLICAERSASLVVALVASMLAGAPYVPADVRWPRQRIGYLIQQVAPSVILTDQAARQQHGPFSENDVPIESLPTTGPAPDLRQVPGDADPAYIIYTSGSTGRPKGVVVPHRGVVNRLRAGQLIFPIGVGDTVLQKTPYTFDISVWEFFWPLVTGARLCLAVPDGHRDPEYLLEVIHQEGVTIAHFVPSMLALIVREPLLPACETLKLVIASGEELSASLARAFRAASSAELHNMYGPTEASIEVTHRRCRDDEPGPAVPIGRPIVGVRTPVLGEGLRPVRVGEIGELYLGGICLADGYLGQPDLTETAFVPDPDHPGERLYRTGDLARWTEAGELEFCGRRDHQVKLNGVRVELGEIEAVALEQPEVAEAVAVVRQTVAGAQVVLYVVAPGSGSATLPGLSALLAAKLPVPLRPFHTVLLERLPLTPNGKCDRDRLPAPPLRRERRQFRRAQLTDSSPTERG